MRSETKHKYQYIFRRRTNEINFEYIYKMTTSKYLTREDAQEARQTGSGWEVYDTYAPSVETLVVEIPEPVLQWQWIYKSTLKSDGRPTSGFLNQWAITGLLSEAEADKKLNNAKVISYERIERSIAEACDG